MAETTNARAGSAAAQSASWGERAVDWAEVMEGQNGWGIPVYRRILERVPVDGSTRLLDVGCGAGRFCRIARDRGATVAGLDATSDSSRSRWNAPPRASSRSVRWRTCLGKTTPSTSLPGSTRSFWPPTWLARCARRDESRAPGATLALTVWGRSERCDSTGLFAAMRRLVEGEAARSDESEPDAPRPPALHEEQVMLGIAHEAGLRPTELEYFQYVEEYRDVDTMARGMLAAPPGRAARRATSADAVRDALAEAVQPRVSDTGTVRLREEVRYLIAIT